MTKDKYVSRHYQSGRRPTATRRRFTAEPNPRNIHLEDDLEFS